jgi:hypothetical protein
MKFACEAGGAPAEIEGRLAHRDQWRRHPELAREDFDFCDDITSGYMMGFCAALSERMAAVTRETRLKSLLTDWPAAHVAAFKTFRRSADVFFATRSELEVDLSGSASAMFAIEERASLSGWAGRFVGSGSSADISRSLLRRIGSASEAAMASTLKRLQAKPPEYGTVTAEGILKTQRAWTGYRAGWLRFARVRYPYVHR